MEILFASALPIEATISNIYERYGGLEYWLVDARTRLVEV